MCDFACSKVFITEIFICLKVSGSRSPYLQQPSLMAGGISRMFCSLLTPRTARSADFMRLSEMANN
jgi:hypothetical protein